MFQVAHMSKSELSHLDVTLFVPLAFFVNAYMSLGVPEHFILLLSLVSEVLCIQQKKSLHTNLIHFLCEMLKPVVQLYYIGKGYCGLLYDALSC